MAVDDWSSASQRERRLERRWRARGEQRAEKRSSSRSIGAREDGSCLRMVMVEEGEPPLRGAASSEEANEFERDGEGDLHTRQGEAETEIIIK